MEDADLNERVCVYKEALCRLQFAMMLPPPPSPPGAAVAAVAAAAVAASAAAAVAQTAATTPLAQSAPGGARWRSQPPSATAAAAPGAAAAPPPWVVQQTAVNAAGVLAGVVLRLVDGRRRRLDFWLVSLAHPPRSNSCRAIDTELGALETFHFKSASGKKSTMLRSLPYPNASRCALLMPAGSGTWPPAAPRAIPHPPLDSKGIFLLAALAHSRRRLESGVRWLLDPLRLAVASRAALTMSVPW